VSADKGGDCSEAMLVERAGAAYSRAFAPELMTVLRPGFAIKAALINMGCRSRTGSPVQACTAVQGDLYMFSADAAGCLHTPPDLTERFWKS